VKILVLSLIGVAAALFLISLALFSRPLPLGREQYLRGTGDASTSEAREAERLARAYRQEFSKLDRGSGINEDDWLGRRADAQTKVRSYSHLAQLDRDRADDAYSQAALLSAQRLERFATCNRLAALALLAAAPCALVWIWKGNKKVQPVTHPN
jgi:hypothetical protein